jgi:hypothetical protein
MAIDVLNDLLEAEMGTPAVRLGESHPFCSGATAAEAKLLRQIAAEQREHVRMLTAAIVRLGGVPRPPRPDMLTARLHYLNSRYLIGLIADAEQRLVQTYRLAIARLAPRREPIVAELLARHERRMEQLEGMKRPAA